MLGAGRERGAVEPVERGVGSVATPARERGGEGAGASIGVGERLRPGQRAGGIGLREERGEELGGGGLSVGRQAAHEFTRGGGVLENPIRERTVNRGVAIVRCDQRKRPTR